VADVVDIWTGRSANALRQALRMTHEGFAAKLGTSVRGVAKWSAEPDVVPVTELQRALDTMLSQSTEDSKSRFRMLQTSPSQIAISAASNSAALQDDLASDLKLDHDPATADLLDWLDTHAGWNAGTARSRVRATLNTRDEQRSRALARARADVPRSEIAATLGRFYDVAGSDMIAFSAQLGGEERADTSIVTRPEWLDLRLILGVGDDQLRLRSASPAAERLDGLAADAAVERIGHMVARGTRFANRPLYQLSQLEVGERRLSGEVALTDFITYALTMDVLEHETLDAIVNADNSTPCR
jgi:hypothetical protein